MTDKALARGYTARVLAHPDQHSTEEVAVARLLQHLLPTPTLDEMTFVEQGNTIGMWATVDPGDDSRPWRGIIAAASRHGVFVCNPTAMRLGMKPDAVPASTVTPDPTVPRAWNANGTPARPEPAPDGDEKPAPAPALPDGWRLADHEDHGRVIVTNPTPNRSGQVYFVLPSDTFYMGYHRHLCDLDELTYLDTDQKPEDVAPAEVGDVIESADDPRLAALPDGSILIDRDDDAVVKWGGDWSGAGYIPNESQGDEFGPWTVRRIDQEADQ